MKIFRLSKFLFLCAITAVIGFYSAEGSAGQRRAISDMMARRNGHNTSFFSTSKATTPQRRTKTTSDVSGHTQSKTKYTDLSKDGSLFPGGSCVSCGGNSEDKDGSLFPGGPCVNCHESGPLIDTGSCEDCHKSGPLIDTGPCESCKTPEKKCKPCVKPIVKPQPIVTQIPVQYAPVIYKTSMRNCCAMAPLTLAHVDFNLNQNYTSAPYGQKIGNYRFRIFGCRRYDKSAMLNRGRVLEKDMNFNKIFADTTGDCYNLIDIPQDICLQTTPSPLPEYVLTAEITDFFMNICDQYDWQAVKKANARNGSAEMTVKWRLSNLSRTAVLWEGTTVGYSDLEEGVENGEMKLLESAFADAASNLQVAYGFEDQLMVRLTPEELTAQRNALIDEEIALNPAKCHYQEELKVVKNCQVSRPEFKYEECPRVVPQQVLQPVQIITEVPEVKPVPVQVDIYDVEEVPVVTETAGVIIDYKMFDNCIDERGGVIAGGQCMVVDDTWIDVKQDVNVNNDFCIVDRPPYEALTPENLEKIKASVVEVRNTAGQHSTGLIISESFVLTSADLVEKTNNAYVVKTVNGNEISGKAVRFNPAKNIALIMLDQTTDYTPLPLNLDLPQTGRTGYMVAGTNGTLYNDNVITGYRYSEDLGSEIIVDTNKRPVYIGNALIDGHGTVSGIAHTRSQTDSGSSLFLPTETALRSIGLKICEKLYDKSSPWQQTVYKPVTEIIMTSTPKAPEVMEKKDRK